MLEVNQHDTVLFSLENIYSAKNGYMFESVKFK